MLFDLQGPRKTFVKTIYIGLVVLMGGGLVLFGIGSDVQGGFADLFGASNSTGTAKSNVKKYAKQVEKDPKDKDALANLIAARYTLAGDPANYDDKTNTFSDDGEAQLKMMIGEWKTYEKIAGKKPNIATMNFVVSGYLGLQDAKGATKVQQLITEQQPSASNYLALMLYASYAGEQLVASGAEARALQVATKDEKKDVKLQIRDIKDQMKERNEQITQQIQEQFAEQSQAAQGGGVPSNPFSGGGAPAGE